MNKVLKIEKIQTHPYGKTNVKSEMEVEVTEEGDFASIQIFEEGLFGGDADLRAGIELTAEEARKLRDFLNEALP